MSKKVTMSVNGGPEVEAKDILGRPLFKDEPTVAADYEIYDWKSKLVLANVHLRRMETLKKALDGELTARIKHYKVMSAALADAIRFKSRGELERAFGPEDWEREVEAIKPFDKWHDSLKHWSDQQKEDDA